MIEESTILVHNFFYRTAYAQSIVIRTQLAIALIVILLLSPSLSYPLCPFSSLSWVLIGSFLMVLQWWHSLILSSMQKRSMKYSLLMMVRNEKRSTSRSVMEGLAQGLFCHIFGISTYVSATDKSTITPAYPLTIIQDCTFSPVYHLSSLLTNLRVSRKSVFNGISVSIFLLLLFCDYFYDYS